MAFHISEPFSLAEDTADVIAQLGASFEMHNGDLLIADRALPRVRRYTARGELVRATGRFGDGPGEFRAVGGVMEDATGRIAITDSRLGRVSVLSSSLQTDTILRPTPPAFGPVAPVPDGMLVGLWAGREGTRFYRMDWRGSQGRGFYAPPPAILSQPYWGSVARNVVTASTSRIFAATSLSYPIAVYDMNGDSVGLIGAPPASFRPVPPVERGAFTGPGADQRIKEWLESFVVIGRLDVISDRYLVVTHAVLHSDPARRFEPRHTSLDVYDLLDNRKIFEDIALPVGSHVLTGRDHLYIMIAQPPDPWTLVRLTVATP